MTIDFRLVEHDDRCVSTTQRLVGPLRVLLALAFTALLVAQLRALPAVYDDRTRGAVEPVGPWLLAVGVLELLCVQVVVVCTWRLLTLVRDDRIFSDDALVWVDTIVGALAAAELLLLGTLVVVSRRGGPPALSPVVLLLVLVAGAVVGLLVVVMRALLRQATALRTEMDAVV